MFGHLLNSEALDIAESLALEHRNPWSSITTEEQRAVKLEISKRLTDLHEEPYKSSERDAFRALGKISLIQYGIYTTGLSAWTFFSGANSSVYWWIFLFYGPLLTFLMNYIFVPLNPAAAKQRVLVKQFDQAQEIGLQRFLQALEELKYSSSPKSSGPKPHAKLAVIRPEQAEELCAAWLRSLGFLDAAVTRYSRDGGIDVESQYLCAQVKHQKAPVGVKAIRELYGVAVQEKKTPVFFALSDYTQEAKAFATKVNMPIIRYYSNSLLPINEPGALFVSQGPRFISRSTL
jgi:hypothetical protein